MIRKGTIPDESSSDISASDIADAKAVANADAPTMRRAFAAVRIAATEEAGAPIADPDEP